MMKRRNRKLIIALLAVVLTLSVLTGCGSEKGYKIALITMDSVDRHWISLNEGAQEEAKKMGVTVDFMSPTEKDDVKQIEYINNAVAAGYDAIMVAANGPDSISRAIKEAEKLGVKIVYVDSAAAVQGEATFSTDNFIAGQTAGKVLIEELEKRGIMSGSVGVITFNVSTLTSVNREEGFRSAFEGTSYTLLESQCSDGDASKAQSIAENYITQGVVAIFGNNEGCTTGVGNAIKADPSCGVVGIGFDQSDTIKGLIRNGYIYATMAQNPEDMGKLGVYACVDALNGKKLGGVVTDTGVRVLTNDTIDE